MSLSFSWMTIIIGQLQCVKFIGMFLMDNLHDVKTGSFGPGNEFLDGFIIS